MNPAVLQTSVNAKMYWIFTRSARFNYWDNAVTFFVCTPKVASPAAEAMGF
jgi:hypothetical protein